MHKVIIFGKGFIGTRLANDLGYKIVGREINPLENSVLISFLEKEKPDVIINAIGKTGRPNIDECEYNREETIQSNVIIPAILATEAKKRNIYFIHISSGCIYNGDNGGNGFSEIDPPNFFGSIYSRSKILAEAILKEFLDSMAILRIRMPIDDRPGERNLIDKLKKYLQQGGGIIDIPNSMTIISDLVEVVKQFVKKPRFGIYNVTNPGEITAYKIMKMYKEIVDPKINLKKISLDELDKIIVAKRSNCILNTDKLYKEGIFLKEINEALNDCLRKYSEASK